MTSSDYRAKARDALAGKWGMALLVSLVAGLLGGLLTASSFEIELELDAKTLEKLPDIVRTYLTIAASIGGTMALARFILSGAVQLGYCKYLLKLHDGKEADFSELFSEFHRFADGLVLNLLTSIYTFLWFLVFVIPGFVAMYKYAMAPFILQENPGMRPSEAITASKEMMDGNKGYLFTLDLSFIGWDILNSFTLGIGSLWLNPYKNMARAAFYRDLCPGCPVPEAPETVFEPQIQA